MAVCGILHHLCWIKIGNFRTISIVTNITNTDFFPTLSVTQSVKDSPIHIFAKIPISLQDFTVFSYYFLSIFRCFQSFS